MVPVEFPSSESLIQGYFFPAAPKSIIATVLFLQGFPGIEGDELICGLLAQAGFNVLTFNYRGTFQSGGYFSFSNALADIGAALRFIKASEEISSEEVILGGWSFGAAMVPAGAVQHPEIKRLLMVSGRNFGKEARKIANDPEYASQVAQNLEGIRIPNGPVNFQDDLISDLISIRDALDSEKLAPYLKDRDILLISGWDDEIVPIEDHTIPFYRALMNCGAAQTRIEAVQDGHEFLENKEQLVKLILDWLREE